MSRAITQFDDAFGILSASVEAGRIPGGVLGRRKLFAGCHRPYRLTGTGLRIDFARGHAWTLLTNTIHPARYFDSGINALHRAKSDLINAD